MEAGNSDDESNLSSLSPLSSSSTRSVANRFCVLAGTFLGDGGGLRGLDLGMTGWAKGWAWTCKGWAFKGWAHSSRSQSILLPLYLLLDCQRIQFRGTHGFITHARLIIQVLANMALWTELVLM